MKKYLLLFISLMMSLAASHTLAATCTSPVTVPGADVSGECTSLPDEQIITFFKMKLCKGAPTLLNEAGASVVFPAAGCVDVWTSPDANGTPVTISLAGSSLGDISVPPSDYSTYTFAYVEISNDWKVRTTKTFSAAVNGTRGPDDDAPDGTGLICWTKPGTTTINNLRNVTPPAANCGSQAARNAISPGITVSHFNVFSGAVTVPAHPLFNQVYIPLATLGQGVIGAAILNANNQLIAQPVALVAAAANDGLGAPGLGTKIAGWMPVTMPVYGENTIFKFLFPNTNGTNVNIFGSTLNNFGASDFDMQVSTCDARSASCAP